MAVLEIAFMISTLGSSCRNGVKFPLSIPDLIKKIAHKLKATIGMSLATVAVKVNIFEVLRPDIFIKLSKIIRLTLSKSS